MKLAKFVTIALTVVLIAIQSLPCSALTCSDSLTVNLSQGRLDFTYHNRLYSNAQLGVYVEYAQYEDETPFPVFVTQSETDNMGTFAYKNIKIENCGYYTLYVSPMHGKDGEMYSFEYITPEEAKRRTFLNIDKLDKDSSYTEADNAISEGIFYIASYDGIFYDEINSIKSDNDKLYKKTIEMFLRDDYSVNNEEEFIGALKSAVYSAHKLLILEEIKSVEHSSQIETIITNEKNVEILGLSNIISSYNNLISKDYVNNYIKNAEFDTTDEFVAVFKKAIEESQSNEKEYQQPAVGGQSSGKPKPSYGGGGSSAGFSNSAYNTSENIATIPFSDLDTVPWAKPYITKLYSNNLINGKSSDTFAPDDNIKREEFVKLAVDVFGLKSQNTTYLFSDVKRDAWYAKYVDTAASCGIVNGMGDGSFGIGKFAKRQDMAVVLYNCLSQMNINMRPAAEPKDFVEVSDYAKEAVLSLYAEGIIQGDHMGFFSPHKNVTRAECAVMLCRIYEKYMDGGADK